MTGWEYGGFGLYLHWPFCQSKCPYCDFNSHVATSINEGAWRSAYLAEIDRLAAETKGRVLQSIYFGGGTPSLMSPSLVADFIDRIRSFWPMVNDPEITLEANPGSVEAGRFAGFRQAGVNRVSMGLQALNDVDLRRLGRKHTAAEARQAFEIARKHFDRVSLDLIYARQDQTLDDWRIELKAALELAVDHLSLYQLTIEEGTVFAARHAAGHLRGLPDEDLAVDMFTPTQEICEQAGLPAYEVSNHAAPGSESRHNLIYWRGGDYLGIGPGAHGRLTDHGGTRFATECPRLPQDWLAAVRDTGSGELPRAALCDEDRASEYLLMSIRLREGLDVDRLERMSGTALNQNVLNELQDFELIALSGRRLIATEKGRLMLNHVIRKLAGA